MKRLTLLVLVMCVAAAAQIGSGFKGRGGVSTSMLEAVNLWEASGTTRITPKDSKAVYAESLIVKYNVVTYDSVKNTLRVGGLGGASVPLTVVGNKTTGNIIYAYNDKTGSIDSLFYVGPAGGIYNKNVIISYFSGSSSNGGQRVYMGSDTLALFNGAKTGRDSTVTILPNGYVGINKIPTNPLDVSGTAAVGALSSSGNVITTSGSLQGNTVKSYSASTDLLLTTGTAGYDVYTDRTFGFNTSSPGAQVEINGNKSADTLLIVRNDRVGAPYDSSFVVLSTGGTRTTGMYGNNSEQAVTVTASATTFAVLKNNVAVTGDAGGNTIATITGGGAIGTYVLRFIDDKITITDTADGSANTVNLSAAFTSTANDIMVLYWNGTSWYECSRSVN